MENNKNLELLFQFAKNYKFEAFHALFRALEAKTPSDELGEAYLFRAQIKLYTSDLSILDDLKKAEKANKPPLFPPLITVWKGDGLNHFMLFPKAQGALQAFLAALPLIGKKLFHWYAVQSDVIISQLQGEILYFQGKIHEILPFVDIQRAISSPNPINIILALILEYRYYLAQAESEKAHECMFDIIRCSKAYPECVKIYKEFRRWANLTTGWSGDSPRVYEDEAGEKQPVLADRLEGIRLGFAQDTPFELSFFEYAKACYTDCYSLRQYYMDWFHAMYWLSVGDFKQAECYFYKVYQIAADSGIYMPIYECGVQVMPMMKHLIKKGTCLPLDNLIQRSTQYEAALNKYRLADI